MLGAGTIIGSILGIGEKVIDHFFPNAEEAAAAKLELLKLQQNGEFRELEARMSAIVAEAKSSDPWTSRARPSFMYVIYVMLLASLPMGVLYAFDPGTANSITVGVKSWLRAIPDELYALFGAGYLGYTGARSYDKRKLLEKLQ